MLLYKIITEIRNFSLFRKKITNQKLIHKKSGNF